MSLPAYDPDRYLQYHANHRLAIYRKVAIFVPSGAAFTWFLLVVAQQLPSTILAVILLGICALALDIEGLHAVRDLRAKPIVTTGPVDRIWTKGRFVFIGRVHYLLVGRRLFEVDARSALELQPGDEVSVLHWPHTNVILTLEKIPSRL